MGRAGNWHFIGTNKLRETGGGRCLSWGRRREAGGESKIEQGCRRARMRHSGLQCQAWQQSRFALAFNFLLLLLVPSFLLSQPPLLKPTLFLNNPLLSFCTVIWSSGGGNGSETQDLFGHFPLVYLLHFQELAFKLSAVKEDEAAPSFSGGMEPSGLPKNICKRLGISPYC